MLAVLMVLMMPAVSAPDSGQVLYRAWCSSCHGMDGRGISKHMTRLEVPAADLAACASSTAEPRDSWISIVRDGGAARGLSIDMPAFGDNATAEQIAVVVDFARSLCAEKGWPPGELNFPRAFFSEKAFPENELVAIANDREQQVLYERRLGKRFQVEAVGRTLLDGGSVFESATAALKYNAFYSIEKRLIGSFGVEATPPIGRQAEFEVEPYFAFGAAARNGAFLQGEALATLEDGFGGGTLNLGAGKQVGRFAPMLEGEWTLPNGAPQEFVLAPQVWFQLSRLGHVAGSVGTQIPVAGPGSHSATLFAFLLWDFGDAPLNRGW